MNRLLRLRTQTPVSVLVLNPPSQPTLTPWWLTGLVLIWLSSGAWAQCFQTATSFGVGSNPQSVAVGDFNGDGKPDLATANVGSNEVSVLLGSGSGGFGPATNFGVGDGPFSVAVGDFNGDGKPDLAVANNGSDNVSVLYNCTPPVVNTCTGANLPTVTLVFNNSATVMGTGVPTITVPNTPGQTFQVLGGNSYERVIVIDRINGYEIRQTDSNPTGVFTINRLGLFSITVTTAEGCSRTVQGILANP